MLLWAIERDGWLVLGFERAPGIHPSLSPGSPDLDAVRELVVRIGDELTPCPAGARRLSDRWADAPGWAALLSRPPADLDPWAREHLETLAHLEGTLSPAGDTLAHVDLHPGNVLVGAGRAVAVDWAWSARGPRWFDPAYVVVRLISEGHSPKDAEAWAQDIPAYADTDANTITAFAVRLAGVWEGVARSPKPREHGRRPVDTAREWARHRLA